MELQSLNVPGVFQALGVFFHIDPRAPSPGLRPYEKREGKYILYRSAFGEMILFIEPPRPGETARDSFDLYPFDCERILRFIVGCTEMEATRIMDWVYNFRCVSFDTESRWIKSEPIPTDEELLAGMPTPGRRSV